MSDTGNEKATAERSKQKLSGLGKEFKKKKRMAISRLKWRGPAGCIPIVIFT